MLPISFWRLFFGCYCVLQCLYILSAFDIVPLSLWGYSPFMFSVMFCGMMIEQWRDGVDVNSNRWLRQLSPVGVVYVVPLMLAEFGRIYKPVLILSVLAFACLTVRLFSLKNQYLA